MDGTRWMTFDDLCVDMQLSPAQLRRLIKAGKIVGICHGRPKRLRSDWRYVDPGERYKRALALQAKIQSRKFEIDLGEFPVISSAEFATLCGFSTERVRGLIFRKVLKPHKIGKYSFFTANQVRDFLFRRDHTQHKDLRPRMNTILAWAMQYLETQKSLAMPLAAVRDDDELEGMLRKLMALKEPHRSRAVKEFWRRHKLAQDVAKAHSQRL